MHDVRHLVAAWAVARVALGEFEKTVAVWDVTSPRRISIFDTVLDFGGERLALSGAGDVLIAAAYHRYGVAAYDVSTGDVMWQRRDIKRPQRLTVSHSARVVYVGTDEKPCLRMSLDTGETVGQLRGVRRIVESPYAALAFVDQARPVVSEGDSVKAIFAVERTTFAFLSIAFGHSQLAVSEAGGPVRCFELSSGLEVWRFTAAPGVHCLELAYGPELGAFVGVLWSYQSGGHKKLVAFDADGKPSPIKDVGCPAVTCFCAKNSSLLTNEGRLIHLASGDEVQLDGLGVSAGPG